MTPADIYQENLAKIHIDGYAFHWEGAASTVLRCGNFAGSAYQLSGRAG